MKTRAGASPQAAIHAVTSAWPFGLQRDHADCHLALLAFGSGVVRGFAVVHCIGILTTMFSAVFFSRGLVNLWYGGKKKLKTLSIGQVWKPEDGSGHRFCGRSRQQQLRRKIMEFFRIPRHPVHEVRVVPQRGFLHHFLAVFPFSRGLHLSVEFTGGTVMEVASPSLPTLGRCVTPSPRSATPM
ncbi:hypothetical protein J4711_14550 [Staphylococcus epidermidis]|nr:hypothetical protein [Staphylococcus epidermidis]